MVNIKIKEIAIYHPEHVIHNEFFIDHFKNKGRDSTNFIQNILGRENRYVINDNNESSLTMAYEASKLVLEKASLSGQELDIIMFSSQTPEYLATSNAIQLHAMLQAGHQTQVLDTNANCAGMLVAIDYASRYMMSNPHVQTALVVGSDYNTLMSNPEEEITYANFGDAACAVILEKTEEDTGFMDSIYFTDSVTSTNTNFPRHGLSGAIKEKQDQSMQWIPFDGSIAMPPTYEMFETILSRNNYTMRDLNAYCFSQFSIANIKTIQEHYGLDENKIMYVGDRYGYTGTTSPLMAFYDGIETGRIKRGDTVLFWTIGGGYQLVAMLLKY
ncbi:ketoacyl-ACP synthase III [Robertmurraya kyonggiensis]|uniref:Ketoacyl-ACP synthase III n=1 Tax=Robertmurraya kyonggiensis TaxID=1037680 RepID=A0A4U1DAN5_9BACI|nr:ketoacyl-ACP synthase III [Robertmurraya kyonggiensis]TKC19238.1 ketoacyl-ACP synthase III [Robertmurraya kyonggiensis]